MNWRSSLLTTAFFGVSLTVHATMIGVFAQDDPIEIAGGAESSSVRLGNDFEDLATGILTGDEIIEITPEDPVELAVEPPLDVVEPETTAPVAEPQPVTETALTPVPLATTISAIEPTTAPVLTTTIAALEPNTALVPLALEPVAPTNLQSISPVAPLPVTQVQPETITALADAPVQTAPPVTRPKARPKPVEVKRERPKTSTQARAAPKPQPKGNSTTTAQRGSQQGTQAGKDQNTAPRRAASSSAGNAAASNYPGQVLRKLSRLRKPRVGFKGTAVILFSIASDGSVTNARVSRSSGLSELDTAALNLIRKVGSFAPPPPGARRDFSIRITGR